MSIVIIRFTSFAYYNNCSLDFHNTDLWATFILFSRKVFSHKTDRILSKLRAVFIHNWQNSNCITAACSVLPFILITRVSSLMNAFVWECLREISINVSKLLIVHFVYVHFCRVVVIACLFVYPLFLYCTLLLLV